MTSGVYRIYNTKNNKSYIGQSLNVKRRLEEHYRTLNSLSYKHHSSKLQDDWNEYGEKAFRAEVLEFCPESELENREKYWMYFYDSANKGYNIRTCYNKSIKEELDKLIQQIESLKERI